VLLFGQWIKLLKGPKNLKPKAGLLFFFCFLIFIDQSRAEQGSVWKQTATEHFIFIYQEQDRASIRELVSFCEEVYNQVAGYFDSYPRQIRCVVYGNTDLANGYYSFPPHHIGLYVAAPISPWMGFRHSNWLKLLLIHELTHYIHLRSEKGFFASLSILFGEGVKGADTFFLPGWMIEGVTTNSETIFSEGGRGRNPFFEIYYKAPLLEDHFFTLQQAEYSSVFPPSGRQYVAGYILIDFLMNKFGRDVFKRIDDEYEKWPLFGPWQAIKKVTGFSVDKLFTEMREDLLKKYQSERALPQGELITPEEFADYTLPVITEEGWYLYRSNLNSFSGIVQYDPASKQEKVLVETVLTDEYSFSADRQGKIIVFASPFFIQNPRLIDSDITSDLYVYDKTTGVVKRLTRGAHLYHPALSADGKSLIAVQRAGSYSRLVEVNLDTGSLYLLFAQEGTSVYNPVFSPDGKRIVFTLHRRGVEDIYLLSYPQEGIPLKGNESILSYNEDKIEVVLGPDDSGEYYPRFTDNETLLFSSDREGRLALYSFSLSSKDLFLICEEPIAAIAGVKLADGLIYASYSWRGFCVKKMSQEKLVYKKVAGLKPVSNPPMPQWEKIQSTDYVDWPLFQFWLPFPNMKFLNTDEILWGGGIYLLGVSPLQTCMYSLLLSVYPSCWQPEGRFALQTAVGLLDINYYLDLSYQYTADELYRQSITNTILLSLPLLADRIHNVRNKIAVYSGLSYSYDLYDSENFSFLHGFDNDFLYEENEVDFIGGLNFSFVKQGGIIDFYAPLALTGDAFVQVPLPVFPDTEQGFHTVLKLTVNLPLFIPHAVLKLGCQASYTTEELLGYPVVKPRGMFDVEPQEKVGRALFSLDILFPLALLDQPLGGGLHIDGMGAGLHVETLGDFQFKDEYFSFAKHIYLGSEFVFIVGLGEISIPVGVGVSFRINPENIKSFDLQRDIRPYLFLGFNSFLGPLIL
jgi:hypothetical protein